MKAACLRWTICFRHALISALGQWHEVYIRYETRSAIIRAYVLLFLRRLDFYERTVRKGLGAWPHGVLALESFYSQMALPTGLYLVATVTAEAIAPSIGQT